jgi:hypothetical protein
MPPNETAHQLPATPRFELLPVDGPETSTFPHKLNFIVRMTMGPMTTPGQGTEEEDGDIDIPMLGSNEAV